MDPLMGSDGSFSRKIIGFFQKKPLGVGTNCVLMTPQGIGMGLEGLYSAISGLQTSSVWLDVIGNNISNVNTTGYKSSSTFFSNQLSQTLAEGEGDNPAEGLGGTNAVQVGLGDKVSSIATNFNQGVIQETGITTDIAIQGSGFLVARSGSQTYLTRAGNLNFDSQGYLVDGNGDKIQGYTASTVFTKQIINSFSNIPGQPLAITYANLKLNDSDPANISNIQINPNMVIPPKATTEVNFTGNLDSFQQPNVLNLDPPAGATLPVGVMLAQIPPPNGIDTARMTTVAVPGGGFELQQVANLSLPQAGTQTPVPLDNGIITLDDVQANAGNYAWEQQPPIPPAAQAVETVYDSLGNAHQITVQFYQVNSLSQNAPQGPSQACYAWYAFDTTGGQPVSTANLVGGTSIWQGEMNTPVPPFGVIDNGGYDTGVPGEATAGDFLWFNTDGSLASSGGIDGPPAGPGLPNFMVMPTIFLPFQNKFLPVSPLPTEGAQIMAVQLNFGNYGILGIGQRNGVFSDAEGSYQTVNGVNTYVPQNTISASGQNGYADGTLEGLSFDKTGTIVGSFSNGQDINLAQVALASVANPEGLQSVGNNNYIISPNSGSSQLGLAAQNGLGLIQGGALEESNVDLTTELSNMILAQRSYEANARMVAAVNGTLQTLVALGQGA